MHGLRQVNGTSSRPPDRCMCPFIITFRDECAHSSSSRAMNGTFSRTDAPAPLSLAQPRLAVVDELQGDVELLAPEQGDHILQLVLLLGRHPELIALNLSPDALGPLVPDDLRDLPGIVLGDALLQADADPVLLARRL